MEKAKPSWMHWRFLSHLYFSFILHLVFMLTKFFDDSLFIFGSNRHHTLSAVQRGERWTPDLRSPETLSRQGPDGYGRATRCLPSGKTGAALYRCRPPDQSRSAVPRLNPEMKVSQTLQNSSGSGKNTVQHFLGQPPCQRVLLTWVIAAQQRNG